LIFTACAGRRDSEGRALGGHHDLHIDCERADEDPVRCDVAMTGEITLRGKVLPMAVEREIIGRPPNGLAYGTDSEGQ